MKTIFVATGILAFSASVASFAAETAGRVLAVAGNATIERSGQQQPLQVGTLVESGDTLAVGDKSTVQVRFTDESLVSLRPNSLLKIENYRFNKNAEDDRSLMGLLKGGMRTITGLIGKANNKNYAVQTATATIGIRGTHFVVVSCNNDCTRPDGMIEANGTFGSVTDGRVTVSNASGVKEFAQQDSFHVPTANSAPIQLLAPPVILSDRGRSNSGRITAAFAAQDGNASGGSGRNGGARVSNSPQPVEQSSPRIELIARINNFSSGDLQSGLVRSGGEVTTVELKGFRFPGGFGETRLTAERLSIVRPALDDPDLANTFIFNAQMAATAVSRFRPVNSSSAAGAFWYYVPPAQSFGLGTHRAFGDAPAVSMPAGGVAQYSYAGATQPTDNFGRTGTFNGSNLMMNFGNQKVTNQSPITISFAPNAAMNVQSTYNIPVQNWFMTPGTQNLTGVGISCTPSCPGATAGAVNGRFTGNSGQGYLLGTQVFNSQLAAPGVTANTGGNVSVYAKQ